MPDTNAPHESKPRRWHRQIVERFVITGILRLETPAHFGNGETDTLTDMPLLRDELDGSPLLPGTSIVGALRNYLRERELGDCAPPPLPPKDKTEKEEARFQAELARERKLAAGRLFGGARGDDEGSQSPLIVHDALGRATDYELRDGVRIEPETRTAEDEKKYDITLLAAGSTFDLRFDLLIGLPDGCKDLASEACRAKFDAERAGLLKALTAALDGFAKGEVTLGARKRRGFGRCRVDEWEVKHYDLRTRTGLLAWLAEGRGDWVAPVETKNAVTLAEALGLDGEPLSDARKRFTLIASFAIDGSLMVRSGLADSGPDMIHLHSPRPEQNGGMKPRPIFAGTSWAGVLRSRATQIAYTIAPSEKGGKQDDKVAQLIGGIFGPAEIKSRKQPKKDKSAEETKQTEVEPKASRIEIRETEVQGGRLLDQTRIKIDRFTGGAFESALFSEQPLFGNKDSRLKLELSLRLPAELSRDRQQAEIGLLLLLLKDLWTGDLPLGGEVGVGRGRLQGVNAEINYDGHTWRLSQADNGAITVAEGDRAELQRFVEMLREELRYA